MVLLFKALILGVVEGLTEFLPISSTGHLIIADTLLAYPADKRVTFDIFIQLGSILAVVWHYRQDLLQLASQSFSDATSRNLVLKVGLAFLPAAAAGFLCHHYIEEHLFSVPTVAVALVLGGIVILLVERRDHPGTVTSLPVMGWKDAGWIGVAQVASLIPGVSRAGATIIGGLLTGLSRPVATQFSFYLALPTLTAASLYSLLKAFPSLTAADVAPLTGGFVTAFFSALVVIRFFIHFVQSHDLRIFGYYRIVLGLVLLAFALR